MMSSADKAPRLGSGPLIRAGRVRMAALAFATTSALVFTGVFSTPAFAEEVQDGVVSEAFNEATHTIADVQGTGGGTPLEGERVTVEGVVIGDYRSGGYGGISIQTEGSGGGQNTTPGVSDGIFVFLGGRSVDLDRGDLISVTGIATERFGQTQITLENSEFAAQVLAYDVELPVLTPLPNTVLGSDRRQYENMLVTPTGDYTVASSHQLFNFGTLWLNAGSEPSVKSTQTTRPGPAADAIAAANRANRILLDDGWSSRVDSNAHPNDQPYFTKDTVVRNGDRVVFADTGYVLQYGFDDWRLQPVIPIDNLSDSQYRATFTPTNPRPTAPPVVGGDVKVAVFNVENYFTTLRSQSSNARGAANPAQFAIQKAKVVAAISALDADVVTLLEIENSIKFGNPIDTSLRDLVEGLNSAAGSEVWGYVPTPAALNNLATTDFITNAIIYRIGAVEPIGDSATIIDETVWFNAREPIAQTFDFDGKTVTVVANHFKSKSPPRGGNAGPEPADGQGFFNEDRVRQANSLNQFSAELARTSGSSDILLTGDFNAYGQEDPLHVFYSDGWVEVIDQKSPGQYSYTFNGELGSLVSVLASPSLEPAVAGAGVWSINSPEWRDRSYGFGAAEADNVYRSSDHDPVLVGIYTGVEPVSIDVLTINDFHGRIEADGTSAGAAVLAGAVKHFRDENPNTIFAAAGDLIGASTFTSFIQDDNPTIDALNAAGLDVSATGNHEYDMGWADLRDRVVPRAEFEYISANVVLKDTGEPALAPTWVKEYDGVRVGFIGAMTEDFPSLVSPALISELEVTDTVDAVNRAAAALRDGDLANGEADVVILLIHEGAETTSLESITPDTALGRVAFGVSDDVNAIVTGHTHLAYNHVIHGRPVVSAGQYGTHLGKMNIQVDPESKEILSIENQLVPLTGGTPPTGLFPAVPEVQEIVDAAKAEADVLGARKVGEITADFNRARQNDGSENRGGESTIGNFVADVQKWSTGAEIAVMNPGGLRANLTYASSGPGDPDGNVTYREAATVQPFANTLVKMDLTGAQVKALLEQQWQPAGSSRPFLKLGVSKGLTYTYDPDGPAGNRVTSITLDGNAIDPAATYAVTANSFLASGGDNFTVLTEGVNRADTGRVDLQSMVDWFATNETASPDLAQRAVGVKITAPAGESYVAGELVTVSVSSLTFTGGEAHPPEVQLLLGDTVLGQSAIDTTIVNATDETGRAAITFSVPQGVAGAQELTVFVPETGTTAAIPIRIAETPGIPTKPLISLSSTTIPAGGAVTLSGSGFAAALPLTIELRSNPVEIGTVTTSAEGTFSQAVTIPANTEPGDHQIVVISPDGSEVSVLVTITAAAGSHGGLAQTGGYDMSLYAMLAVLLLALGVISVSSRRRSS